MPAMAGWGVPILLTACLLLAMTLGDGLAARLPPSLLGADPRYAIAAQSGWLQHYFAWDSLWYERIARQGYGWTAGGAGQQSIAFFPLWPLVLRLLLGAGLGGTAFRAACLLVAAWFCVASVREMRFLACGLLARRAAFWAVIFYAAYPASIFLLHAYPVALLNWATLAGLNALHARRWWRAALFSGIATAAGPLAVALAVVTAFMVLAAPDRPRLSWAGRGAAAALAFSGLLLFCVWQGWAFGDPLAFVHAQAGWGPAPPWPLRIGRAAMQLLVLPDLLQTALAWRAALRLAVSRDFWGAQHQFQGGLNTAALALCILCVAASARVRPRIVPLHGALVVALYAWFAGAASPGWATMRLIGVTPAPFLGAAWVLGARPRLAGLVALASCVLLVVEEFSMSAGYGVI